MHTARKLDEHEGLQVPAKAKPIKQWAIPEKSKQGRLSEDILFWKKSLDFLGLSLYLWFVTLLYPGENKASSSPEIPQNFATPLGNSNAIQKPIPMEIPH